MSAAPPKVGPTESEALEMLRAFGRARRALFASNEAWYTAGQPKSGPILEAWHARRAEYCDALAALDIAADAALEGS